MNVIGSRIRIRPTRHEDLSFLQALWNDGAVMRYKGYPEGMHATPECMERWWAGTPQFHLSGRSLSTLATPHCLIELLDGTPIGEFSYSLDAKKRAQIDLKLAHAYWGHGYATEAMELALRELFAMTSITKVQIEPCANNPAAQKVYQRCGFRPAPSENHPGRWECTRYDFANRDKLPFAEVA